MSMPNNSNHQPPGHPGIPPRWTSSAKSGVGTALSPDSRVWFTLSHGIFDEIYYARVDQACTRDMGMIVTDGENFFSEEKRDCNHEIESLSPGIPAYQLTNTCAKKRYRITKKILTDPRSDVALQKTHFQALSGELDDYHLHVLLAPHLGNQGAGNNAWLGEYKGNPMLFAEHEGKALALACSAPWLNRSAGYVGYSDGWQDLYKHKRMTWSYPQAMDGNVALTGEIDISTCKGDFVLALGFGLNPAEAGQRALSSLQGGFPHSQKYYLNQWENWQKRISSIQPPERDKEEGNKNIYHISAAVLKIHEAKRFPGGLIASLSIPWGFSRGDDDLGGYHLVWPRDLVESAGALLAVGAIEDARHILSYLRATQEAQGNWPQNMWLDGRPYWSGIQMDETAFPVLLTDLALRNKALHEDELNDYWSMVRRAASFLVQNGPVTPQDRWEEDPGYSPFTLAVEIAALLAAADFAENMGDKAGAAYMRETADTWNENIERWTYVSNTDIAQKFEVGGYYVRISSPEQANSASPSEGFVPIKNRPPGQNLEASSEIVSPDALALVRFGLRSPEDERILNTIQVIDQLLKVETPYGPAWHRYNDDGYGEHEDGSPFDGTGVGRAWPLLTGERAHYALAAGKYSEAVNLMHAMENFANDGGLISEQIWDAPDISEKELFFGKPSGSAMPLVWAHAEYLKLRRSIQDGRVFDMPPQTVERYIQHKTISKFAVWRSNQKSRSIPNGKRLRIELLEPALVHWSTDNWENTHDQKTTDTGLGIHIVDLPSEDCPADTLIVFTIYWTEQQTWEGTDYQVRIEQQ